MSLIDSLARAERERAIAAGRGDTVYVGLLDQAIRQVRDLLDRPIAPAC